jgi:hypothetical protein
VNSCVGRYIYSYNKLIYCWGFKVVYSKHFLYHDKPFITPTTCTRIIKLLIMKFSLLPCYLVLLRHNILLNTLFSTTFSLCASLNVSDQVSHIYKTTDKIIVLNILIFKFLDSQLDDTDSAQNDSKHSLTSICS